ncbi:MAG: zinc-ribbon domain-containing protein [Candidatus Asgardarchaeia archaeon]
MGKNKECLNCGKGLVKQQKNYCSKKCFYFHYYRRGGNDKKSLYQTHKKLMKEWNYEKNDRRGLSPKELTAGSGKKVWWKCGKGHEWEAVINNRKNGCNCLYCYREKLSGTTSLTCLSVKNSILSKEWHFIKNKNLTPEDVMPQSNKKVWWKCGKGHEWEATVNNRSNGRNCPYCSGSKACKDNCLETKYPEIAKEWHPTKNGKLTAKDITGGCNKKVWWKCNKRHEWMTIVNHRARGDNCPYCGGKRVSKKNCLKLKYPELAKEWHPTKNGQLTAKEVSYGSDRKVWWICSKNESHEWESSVSNRVKGQGCPFCYKKNEGKVRELLLKYFEDWNIIPNKKIWDEYKDYKHRRYCDFWLEKDSTNIIVEYDGEQHFKPITYGRFSLYRANKNLKKYRLKDKLDTQFCKENNIILHRIKYDEDKEKSIKRLESDWKFLIRV